MLLVFFIISLVLLDVLLTAIANDDACAASGGTLRLMLRVNSSLEVVARSIVRFVIDDSGTNASLAVLRSYSIESIRSVSEV